ncbi:MAG: hypothetical protein A3J74_06430 [Elusimicrobia bacterium RIFCSPHIGHO2_02_FULL_57_9]|nr:MAG: hypothetical protein A3J74_06430 [Elusimicrobia bacterium RIFCSPHIGHO2_02_FULL_57_9]
MKKPKSGLRKAALLFAIPCVAAGGTLLALELWARWSIARIPEGVVPSGHEHPPYFNNPGVVTSPKAFGYHLKYRINRVGLRGPETTLEKARRRILVLGDSVVFGALVGEEDTLSRQLERILNAPDTASAEQWEVLNGGTGGYDAWDYEGFLKLKGLAFSPDIVVVGIYRNDHIKRKVYEDTIKIKSKPVRPLMAQIRDLVFKSELANALMYFVQRHQDPKRPFVSVGKPLSPQDQELIDSFFPGDARTAEAAKAFLRQYRYDPFLIKDTLPWMLDLRAWDDIIGPMRGIRDECRKRGIPLIAVALPVQFELYPGYGWPEPGRRIARILDSLRIPFIDLKPVLASTGRGDEFYKMRYDYSHPDAQAYALAASAVASKLRELGLSGSAIKSGGRP